MPDEIPPQAPAAGQPAPVAPLPAGQAGPAPEPEPPTDLAAVRASLGQVAPTPTQSPTPTANQAVSSPPLAQSPNPASAKSEIRNQKSELPSGQSAINNLQSAISTSWRVWLGIGLGFLVAAGAIFFLFFWRATVTITVEPATASLQVDEFTGTGSLTAELRPGTYAVTAIAPGQVPFKQEITLGLNEQATLAIDLRATPAPIRLSEARVQFMVLDAERSSLLYLEPSSATAFRLFLGDLDSPKIDRITPAGALGSVTDLIWSPDRQLAFWKLPGNATKQYDFARYDLVNQQVHDWPAGVGSIDWRPDGAKLAYAFFPEGGEQTLIRATKDNGEAERIYNFQGSGIKDPRLAWSPDAKTITVLSDRLFFFDVFSKTLTEVGNTEGLKELRWLPNSQAILAVTAENQLVRIGLDGTTTEVGRAGTLDQLVLLADSGRFLQVVGAGTSTRLELVQIESGEGSELVAEGLGTLSPKNLLLAKDEQTVYFTSAGQPYALELDLGTYEFVPLTE